MHTVGARPNFMKVAPVFAALGNKKNVSQCIVHTGQHYDRNMSDVFFRQLDIPKPDINLGVGSASHAVQTAKIMMSMETILLDKRPDIVVVYGDVNSTVAVSMVCAKLCIPIAHVEAGLRSFDMTMPEEINRVITDRITNVFFTHSRDADRNLISEGACPENIHFVGNVMIDTLVRLLGEAVPPPTSVLDHKVISGGFILVTLHRPSNVDDHKTFKNILAVLSEEHNDKPVVFPIHPRTRKLLKTLDIETDSTGIHLIDPVGYLEFLYLQKNAVCVITDSGGVQEETTYLGVPCLTLRENTERPVTIEIGTNKLIGKNMDLLLSEVESVLQGEGKKGNVPELWDGKAGMRIADILS